MSAWKRWTAFLKRLDEPVWGLGVIIGDREKTVVRAADYERIRAALQRAEKYARNHRGL